MYSDIFHFSVCVGKILGALDHSIGARSLVGARGGHPFLLACDRSLSVFPLGNLGNFSAGSDRGWPRPHNFLCGTVTFMVYLMHI